MTVDEKLNRHAARYLRARPYLTPETCREQRCGFLPSSAKSLLRGKFVYPILDERGDVLTWFGRDPQFESKRQSWEAAGRPSGSEPAKHRFVKGFHRGLEVLGQHEWGDSEVQERIQEIGALLVVEGPNDRIALSALHIPAFAICGNQVTAQQAVKIASIANEIGVPVGLMFDCDTEGYRGAVASLPIIAEIAPVWFAWSPSSHGGHFRDWQPERLFSEPEGIATIRSSLGGVAGAAGSEENDPA